jgi:hypothetical protein
MGREAQVGPDIHKLLHFHAERVRKASQAKKTTARSVGYGIANSITKKEVEKIKHLKAQALMIAKLANRMQEQSQKQFKEELDLFKVTLNRNTSPTPTTPKKGAGKKKKKCPHCKTEVYHMPEACFELDANAAKRPAGWKSKKST